MPLKFKFRKGRSSILGAIHRPVVKVSVWSERFKKWEEIWMLVDTGADYSLLPRYIAKLLGVDLESLEVLSTYGVGGGQRVYFLPKIKVKLGIWQQKIPLGFLDSDEIPPLAGRHMFLETFEMHFSKKHTVNFDK